MAVVVIGGLLLSTLLTLVLVPASFSLADSFERWLMPKFGRIITYRGTQDHGPQPAPRAGGVIVARGLNQTRRRLFSRHEPA